MCKLSQFTICTRFYVPEPNGAQPRDFTAVGSSPEMQTTSSNISRTFPFYKRPSYIFLKP